MSMVISGDGTITGLSAGGLPSATVTQATLATPVAGTGPAFSAYQSVAQSISAGTWTKLTMPIEEFDTNSNYDNATNYRFTPTVAGYYQISGSVGLTSVTGAYIAIYKNGALFKTGASSNSALNCAVSSLIYFNGSTDYVELYCYFGATENTNTGQSWVYFQGILVRAA